MELVESRFEFSRKIVNYLSSQKSFPGKIDLRQGDFCCDSHRSFITEANVIFVNNAFEVFAARAQSVGASLDDYIAGLFAQLKPGSRMVTLYPLPLGDEKDSFFTYEEKHLAEHSVAWSNNKITANIYTRIENQSPIQDRKSVV